MKAERSPIPSSIRVVAMHPYYIARAVGGLLFLIGALVGCYNIWMTIRTCRSAGRPTDCRSSRPGARRRCRASTGGVTGMFNLHYRLERKTIGFVLAIIGVASIGGVVEIAPLFTIHQTVEDAPDMRVYTPLEIAGRNIYIREGCYACHSQMIRTLRDEVERYGPYSLAVESKYDHPMLWGSKRTGPDLARMGDKYSDEWHVSASQQSARRRPAIGHAALFWLLGEPSCGRDDLGAHLTALRKVGVPYTDDMIANAQFRRLRPGGARHAVRRRGHQALRRGDDSAGLRRQARRAHRNGCPGRLSADPRQA